MKPLLALAGIALLGIAGIAGALYVAAGGGEEEVAQQETGAPTPSQELPEGWVRFSHPGTQEAPPFSFAYPGDWHVQEPALIAVTLPKGEPARHRGTS